MQYLDARQLHRNVASSIEQVLEATPFNAPTIRSPTSHHENMQYTAVEVGTSS